MHDQKATENARSGARRIPLMRGASHPAGASSSGRWPFANDRERFLAKVEPRGDCWIWTAYIRKADGYPQFWRNNRSERAHRSSYEMFVGPIPEGMEVCHKCDEPTCVRPEHLFVGTRRINELDKVLKGRTAHGERSGASKLTWDEVREMRRLHDEERATTTDLAERFGVTTDNVRAVLSGDTWVEDRAARVRRVLRRRGLLSA